MTRTKTSQDPKQRLLTQTAPARVSGIADAVVIKDEGLAFVCDQDGCVPKREAHGLGLYYRDCRFLSRYELRLAGVCAESLAASSSDGFRSIFQLTNQEIENEHGVLGRQEIGVRWRHVIDAGDLALRDEIVVRNYHLQEHAFALSLTFDADFSDVFVIRGLSDEQPGTRRAVAWDGEGLVFSYDGGDEVVRKLVVRFSEPPTHRKQNEVSFDLRLAPQEEKRLVVSLAVIEQGSDDSAPAVRTGSQSVADAEDAFERSIPDWLGGFTRVSSSSLWLNRVLDRALHDLRALRMSLDGHQFFAAGVPWFMTLFGRDSLVCGLQTLAFRPEIAEETLRLLASLQGRQVDAFRDEQPGKILHELRVGELARMKRVPHTPYYGTVDATPLFLILLAEHCAWTGKLTLFHEIRDNAEAALRWMDSYADSDHDGYIEYYSSSAGCGLINQGWKDSGDAIVTASGELAEPPIALVEVQAYAYLAKLSIARLVEQDGERERADTLRREAQALRERFNRDYWLPDKDFFALALHGRSRTPIDVISSNPGHALFAGIVPDERAKAVVDRLMAEDMYSGWGVRTLSTNERAYNPIGYHLGTVWPHDCALAAVGFRRYGFDAEACRVFSNLLHAATFFEHDRLPEAFAGFAREGYGVPVRYPVACHPQAWAAGSVPFMLSALLGLEPNAFERRLTITRPCLPPFIRHLELNGLRVGDAEVDLCFERSGDALGVEIKKKRGDLEVIT